ncbi:MAG: leucine-rich repeat domain-containing protein [Spirochaetales bacterium]|nr:leucine-rich repeat domain-containing protein [Spirochaetales bacterium]
MKKVDLLIIVSICIMFVDCGKFEGGLYASKSDSGYVISSYLGSETNIVIPSEIDGIPVIAIGDKAFINKSIQSIEMPNSVKAIGERAFFGCSSLEEVVLSDNIEEIGDEAFLACGSLKTIKLPDKLKKIPNDMFTNCFLLESVELPAQLEEIGDFAFLTCKLLKSIVMPDSVKLIGEYVFAGCDSLTFVKMSEGLVSISDYAFNSCDSLRDLRIPASVKQLGKGIFSSSGMRVVFEGDAPEAHEDVFEGFYEDIHYVLGTNGWPECPLKWYGVYAWPEGGE